jgi:Zn-dependent protease
MFSGQWWVHSYIQAGEVALLISWIFWVIFSICLHELAHGWAALWQGDDTPRRLERMTMNPLVHMGGWSLLIFALIGIAWGVMPTDPSRYRDRRLGRIYVAAAGPAMNIVLAFISLTLAAFWISFADGLVNEQLHNNVYIFLFAGGWLNIVLAAFNLLPIPPLDGSQILSGMSWKFYQMYQNPQTQLFGMFIVLALLITGMFQLFFTVAATICRFYLDIWQLLLP